jgi:predicted nucleic acid-binding protein
LTAIPTEALLDTSVLLRCLLPHDDDLQPAADEVWNSFERSDLQLVLLDLSIYETINVLVRRWGWPGDAVADAMRELLGAGIPIARVDVELAGSAAMIAAEHGLSGYDASFLAAARSYGLPLLTADDSLRRAGGDLAISLADLAT